MRKTALISGGTRGIGLYIAEALLENGYNIISLHRTKYSDEELDDLHWMTHFRCDITDQHDINELVRMLQQDSVRINVLVNCAGYNKNGRLEKLSPLYFEHTLLTNLTGTFNLTKAILPFMEEAIGHKTILNITSVVPFIGVDGTIAYSTSKAGLEGFTKTLSKELAPKRITVNNLALGYFDRGMIEQVPEPILEKIKRKIPLQRLGRFDDIIDIVPSLVKCEYLTGTTIHLNGGLYG